MKNEKLFIISLGGSVIIPKPDKIDVNFLKKFRKLVLDFLRKGHRFIIVTGGGKICRVYQKAASKTAKVSYADLDWLGIQATKMNAYLLRGIFGKEAYPEVLDNFGEKKKLSEYKLIIACGWKPGHSTDFDAVLLAEKTGAKTIINLTNIPYVYDCDFNIYKNAKPIKEISWQGYLKIIGEKWKPGLSTPFDPIAAKLAKKLGKSAIVAKGTDIKNLKNILAGKKFKGTVISG